MKTLTPTKTWIFICSILVVSNASEHASSHHDVMQHGDSGSWKKLQNTIVPYGIQMPDHVLSTQDLSCISADNNIFEIMNKAQETCNGTDLRCTFYHFVNHDYENLGTLDINKEHFDDLLKKFDNWLLTAEDIEKRADDKTKEDSSLETASIGVNGGFSNENSSISTVIKGVDASQGHIDKLNLSLNESDNDRVHSHHLKTPHEIHHKTHHGKDHKSVTAPNIHGKKWKNENFIKLNPEYSPEHRYFEVYIPRDKVTGKPRTIYVEVDQEKNEFILLDEEIDKKLKGIKPIRIELDELSGIADTAFNEVIKASNFKDHVHNHLNDDEKAILSDISKHSEVNVDAVHLDNIDIGEQTQISINPNNYKKEAEEQHKPDDMAGNVKKIINVNENLILPNKYLNQAQFNIEYEYSNNSTDDMQIDHFELPESNNTETGIYADFHGQEKPLDAIEYNENNTFEINGTENSSIDYSDISYENDNDTSTDCYELSSKHENVTSDNDSFVQLEEHDDTHDFSSSNTLNLNEFTVEVENPIQGNKLKSTPLNNAETKLTSSVTAGISDYTGSQQQENPFENRRGGYTDLHDFSLEPSMPLKPYTSVPILGKDSAKIFKTDSYLKSSSPTYTTLDLHAGDSQNPNISSYISPLDSVCTPSAAPKISQYSPSVTPYPPVECIVRLNKDSTYSPLNFGVNWLPSHSRIKDLRIPCEINPLTLDHVVSPQNSILPLTLPSMEYSGSSQSSPDHTTPGKDTNYIQSVPSSSYVIQEPSLFTTPYELETTAPMSPKHVLLSKLGLPKYNTDYETIPTPNPSLVKPCSLIDAVSSPCPIPINLPCLQKNILSPIDSPCSANNIRYPYTTIPYFSNPNLKSHQFLPSYLEPLLQTPLQPASEIPTLDSVPVPLDQSNPCLAGVYPQEKKKIHFLPFAPNSQFSTLNSMLVGPALPCPNIWNNILYPYTDQNIRNNPPFLGNYLTATTDQYHKALQSKTAPISIVEHPCSSKNIFTPSSNTPFLPVHTSLVQKDINPSQALEHDLENLSLKYGIPLSKILHSIESEIPYSKTCSPALKIPNSNLKYDGSLTAQQSYPLSETNENVNDENKSNDEKFLESDLTNLTALDSSLIGPHLELENSLDALNSQSYTILPKTTGPVNSPHSSAKTQQTIAIKDSSLIGPQLSTLSSSNILLSDENQNENEVVLSDYSNVIPYDSSLTGPYLKIGHPPAVLDSHVSQGDILTSQTELISTSSSQIESKLNQNQPTNLLLDSSLTGSHLQSLSPFKPLLTNEIQSINNIVPLEPELTNLTPTSQVDLTNELVQSTIPAKPLLANEIQTINEMIPLKSDLTDLTPLDISQVDFLNEQSEIIQREKSTVKLSANPKLLKTVEYLPTNLVGEDLLLKSDSYLLTPTVSQDNLQKTDIKHDELESIILPSSLLPTLLNKPVKADSNLNIISEDTKLNEDLTGISLDANATPLKETDFKIVEPDLNLNANTQNIPLLESSLIGTSMLPKIQRPVISSTSDSSVQLDNYLIGPSIQNEIGIQSPVFESVDQLESSITAATIDQNIKPSETTTIDSNIQFDSSLMGPTLHSEISSHGTSTVDSVTQFDTSSVASSQYEAGIKTSSVLDAKSHLDSSLIMPSLYEAVESSASSSASSQLESSLLGTSLKPEMETQEVCRVCDSKKLDSMLVGPHLSTVPFSSDEVQMINNNELHQKSELANLIPLDSTLIGPHVDLESHFDQSEISCFQNPESSTSDIAPGILETMNFLNSDFVERHPPKQNTVSSIDQSDLQELLSEFKNSITKSQLSLSEFKPCDNLLSSIAKQLTDNAASVISPITHTAYPEKGLGHILKGPCPDSNYYLIPKTFAELLTYAQRVPQKLITPYSPFIQMRPLVDRNWIPQPLEIQNILQASPGIRPAVGNAPVMPLAPEDLKLLLDLTSQSKTFPQLSMSNISPQMIAFPPSLELTTLSNNMALEKYVPSLPKKNFSTLPSNLEPSICNPEYTPIEVDDIMSLLDENSYKLLKDMSILSPSHSVFETGEIVSPSLSDTIPIFNSDFIKTRPVLPISIPNSQNVAYMIPTPNIPPRDLQPYSKAPLDAQFSEIVDYVPKIESLPIESSKSSLESQWHEIPNTSQLMEPIPNFTLDSEFPQQLLSKPNLESPIILPSSLLDSMLQLPTAPNKSKSYPCQCLPEFYKPVSPVLTIPSSNAYTCPALPIYFSPLLMSFAKPISASSARQLFNVPYADSPLTPLTISPYTASSVIPNFPSPHTPLKSTPLSIYPIAPTEIYNRPIQSRIPYKPSTMYSYPYLPVYPSPLPVENSPYSPSLMSNLTPAETSSISPDFYEPITAPYFSPEPKPKSLTNFGTPNYSGSLTPVAQIPMASSPAGVLPPSYISPDLSAYKYLPVSAPGNALTQPSSTLTPLSPVSSTLSSYNRPLPSKPMVNLKLELTPQELENLRLLNTLPVSNANNQFLNANQMLPTSSNILSLQNYYEHVPKRTPLSNSQIKPSQAKIGSNVLTTSITEETPYEMVEENKYSFINDKDNKYYEDYNFKHPLESLSYTLAPEDIMETERKPKEDFKIQEDLSPTAPITNLAFEPSLQSELYQRPLLTPYTPIYGEKLLRPCTTLQLLPHQSLIEVLPHSILDNILSSPLLKPLTPLTPAVNLSLLPRPCIHTYLRPYKTSQTDETLSFSSPYNSATSQDMLAPPTDQRGLRKIISPQLTSAFSQVSANTPYIPFSSPSPVSPNNLDNYIELPLTYHKPQSKKQDTSVKPTTEPSYNQYAAPITSHVSPLEMPISSQYTSPLTTAERLKKPLISPQYISSILPVQTNLQESCPLNEAPLHYQPYIQLPTVTSPHTIVPSVKMVEPISKNLNSPQWLSFTPQNSLPSSINQLHPKLSPILAQYAYPSLLPSYTSLPFETVPNSQINKRRVPQYSPANVPAYDAPIQSSPLAGNPFLNQYFKPITEVPSCPVPNNQISPLNLTPYESILLSNLRPLDISKEAEIIDELIPYELRPDLKDKFSQLPLNFNQQRQFYAASSYLARPQPTHITSASSKYKTATARPLSVSSVIPEDAELIDTTDFIPITPIQSEALTSSYSPTDRKAPISTTPSNIPESNSVPSSPYTILSNSDFSPSTFKQLPPKSTTNTQSIQEPDISQFFPYSILSNSDFFPTSSKQLPPTIQKQRYNQRLRPSPIYLSPQEYEELTKGLSSSQASSSSSSSPITLPYTNIDPQPITNSFTARPIPLTPLYTGSLSKTPENLLQLPLFGKYSPLQETPIEITPEKENIQSLLNKYRPANKIRPLAVNKYPYEPKSSTVQMVSELDSVKPVNPLIKSKESNVEYIEDIKSNEKNDYVSTENISFDENKPDVLEAKLFDSLAEIIKSVNVPNYYNDNNAQNTQRSSKLDRFYENNHIGKAPQVFTAPIFNTSPIGSSIDSESSYTTISPEIYKDFTVIPFKHLGSVTKSDTSSSLTENYPEIADSVETVPSTRSYSQNYINPSSKSYAQMKPTNAIKVTDTSEIPSSSSFNPFNDIKYSGYKTYQVPSLKFPKMTQNQGTLPQIYSPYSLIHSPLNSGKPPNVYQISSPPEFYEPSEIYEPITPQYQAPQTTSPLQTKLDLDNLQESPEFNDYGNTEDEPVCVDDQEDNELKSSLINYINKRNDITINLDNNNQELTIPLGNIAITKKDPDNADTIETNNPSIALKVWKSNVKIAQTELKLKFKDLSVINFMPVVNKLDNYDMEEIRKIVKNYIDEKYGNHVEINEPYAVDNQYTIIKDFNPDALSNNLLWPINYV